MMSSSNDDAFPIIIDFGLSKIFYKNEMSYERLGTLAFISPEIVTNQCHNMSTDVWSIGIILHILLSGTIPFLSRHIEKTKYNIVNQDIKFSSSTWQSVSCEAKSLLL
jgi:serine/threonine protein kinase